MILEEATDNYLTAQTVLQKLTLFLFLILTCSCTKPDLEETPAPKHLVTIEASSDKFSTIEIPSVSKQNFKGKFSKSYTLNQDVISVIMNSDEPSIKSIIIKIDNKIVAKREGDCLVTNYDLSYDMRLY